MDIHEDIQVQCLGFDYGGWESVQIEQSIQVPWVQATLTTTEVGGFENGVAVFDEWNFPPGSLVEIFASGTMVFSGAVYQYIPSADANQHSVTLVCRTIYTHNFAVSSIRTETGQYQDTTTSALVSQWAAAHGAMLIDNTVNKVPIPYFQVKQGATGWQESMRLIQPYGQMLFAEAMGKLVLSDGMPLKFSGTVIQGVNIEAMSAKLQDSQYVEHAVIGQSPSGSDLSAQVQVIGLAFGNVATTRYKKTIDQRASTIMQANARAAWERNRGLADAMQAQITVSGWRDLDGAFWLIDQDTYVHAPWLHIDCTLRISRLVFIQNLQQGTVTQLTLLDPNAVASLGGSIGSMSKPVCASGSMWDLSWDPAADLVNSIASAVTSVTKYFP